MKLTPQIIKKQGKNEFVVLPYDEYLKIMQILEDYEDLIALRKAKEETINEPSVAYDEVEKLIYKKRDK